MIAISSIKSGKAAIRSEVCSEIISTRADVCRMGKMPNEWQTKVLVPILIVSHARE